jgi:PncC family amidohydrolase
MITTEEAIYRILKDRKLTLGVVESATGGLVTHRLTNVPGVSDVYKGGVNAYANETKVNLVGVNAATLKDYGAVSSQTAEEMALGGSGA